MGRNNANQDRIKFDKVSNLISWQETFSVGDMTDGGSTTGTYTMTEGNIPAGAVYVQTLSNSLTGFAGDTSATIQIGDGTDVDRYSTGTPSVFTTAAAGIDCGVPSGTKFHSAAKTPVVTITSGSDFTAVTAGTITLTFIYWMPDSLQ